MRTHYTGSVRGYDPHDHVQGAWTCMWCGHICVFLWDDEGADFRSAITMLCEYCGGGTFMERNKSDDPTLKGRVVVD